MKNKVQILMSTYNGEKYIRKQIESLNNQKDIDAKVLIRDDGSTDNTVKIIEDMINNKDIQIDLELYLGNNLGYANSFWDLLQKADLTYNYFAFCDQDDIWLENKLINAIKKIENKTNDKPILYTSRVISVNNDLQIISENTFNTKTSLNVYESFQKSCTPGCVFVMNKKAIEICQKYNGYMESHDWAVYSIINVFGEVIYDSNSYILYRIHDNNAIGKNSFIKEIKLKIHRFFNKSKCSRSKFAKDFYKTYCDEIPIELRKRIKYLAYYKENIRYKFYVLFSGKFKGIIFKIYILLNKV